MTTHITIDLTRQRLECQHCGARQPFPLAGSADQFIAAAKRFVNAHRRCTKFQRARLMPYRTLLAAGRH